MEIFGKLGGRTSESVEADASRRQSNSPASSHSGTVSFAPSFCRGRQRHPSIETAAHWSRRAKLGSRESGGGLPPYKRRRGGILLRKA